MQMPESNEIEEEVREAIQLQGKVELSYFD